MHLSNLMEYLYGIIQSLEFNLFFFIDLPLRSVTVRQSISRFDL